MALLFTENFYNYSILGDTLADANGIVNTNWETGTTPVKFVDGFKGESYKSKAIKLTRDESGVSKASRVFTTNANVVILGFSLRANGRGGSIFRISNESGNSVLNLTWTRRLEFNGVKGKTTTLLNRDYYVELKINKTTSKVTVHLNGSFYMEGDVATLEDSFTCEWGYGTRDDSSEMIVGNIYVADDSEGTHTDFLGVIHCETHFVDSEGSEGWEVSEEGMTRLDIMQSTTFDESLFTQSDQVGAKDLYKSNIGSDQGIIAMSVNAILSKTDIDAQFARLIISDDESVARSDFIEVSEEPQFHQAIFETNATGLAWSGETFSTMEYGTEVAPYDDTSIPEDEP